MPKSIKTKTTEPKAHQHDDKDTQKMLVIAELLKLAIKIATPGFGNSSHSSSDMVENVRVADTVFFLDNEEQKGKHLSIILPKDQQAVEVLLSVTEALDVRAYIGTRRNNYNTNLVPLRSASQTRDQEWNSKNLNVYVTPQDIGDLDTFMQRLFDVISTQNLWAHQQLPGTAVTTAESSPATQAMLPANTPEPGGTGSAT